MSSISTYSTGSEEIFIENISSIEDKDKEIENSRFTKHSPLVTLLKMTAGPFALFLQTFLSTLNMFFIAKRFNNEPESHAVEIIGFANQFLTILNFIGNYFGISLTSHVSTLIGKGDRNEAAHLSVDIFRISLLFSFAGAFGLLFAVKPFLNFIGTPSQLIDSTAKYTNFMVLTTPFGNMFLVLIFFMQSIGNSAASGIISLIMRTIITLGLTPLFLFVFKVSTTFMNSPNAIVEALTTIVIFIFVFAGKFSLKPTIKMIFGRFSKETPKSFLLACPFIIYFISFALPPILILQSLTSIDPDHSREIGGVFAVFAQLMSISAALAGVIGQGLLSAGTHAFGSNNIKRLIHLFLWSLLIELVLGTLFSLSIVFFKKPIAKLFISDESEVEFAIKMIPIPFYSSVIQNITTVCMSFLIIIGKPLFAVVQVSTNVILLCSGCKILAHFLKNDPIKVMHVYNLADLSMLVVTALLMIIPIKFIVAKSKDTLTTHQDNLTKVLIEDSLA